MRYLLCCLLSVVSAFALSSNWSVGLNTGIQTGSGQYTTKNGIGRGINADYTLQFSKLGFSIGYMYIDFTKTNPYTTFPEVMYDTVSGTYYLSEWPEPGGKMRSLLHALTLSANYAVSSKFSVDLFAKILFNGQYSIRWTDNFPRYIEIDNLKYTLLTPESLTQDDVYGLEVGVRKKIKWGLWGHVSYHYTSLDKNRVNADSIQWVGLGLNYIWGRK